MALMFWIIFGFIFSNSILFEFGETKEGQGGRKKEITKDSDILEGLGILKWQEKYCGKFSNSTDKPSHRLIKPRSAGARLGRFGEFPSVALLHANWTACSATIISNRHILTTASCVNDSMAEQLKLFVGFDGYLFRDEYSIEDICKHMGFRLFGRTLINDVSVLKTTKEIKFRADVQPICLPKKKIRDHERIYLTSFGEEPDPEHEGGLMFGEYARVLTTKLVQCILIDIHKTKLCVLPLSNGQTCRGDIGGPAVVYRNGKQEAIGIISFGAVEKCNVEDERICGLTDLFFLMSDLLELIETCS